MDFTTSTTIVAILVIAITAYIYNTFFTSPAKSTGAVAPASTGSCVSTKKEPAVADIEDGSKLPMSILFGSQSGTAETFAKELSREAKSYGFQARVWDLEKYDVAKLAQEKFAVFLMATFGEGEPTDNAADFYKWITAKERLEDAINQLSQVDFAVFALGNRQYEHFCNVGRNLDKRLEELGAHRLLAHGEGDDDGSLDEDFKKWKVEFWKAARQHFQKDQSNSSITPQAQHFHPSFQATFDEDSNSQYMGGIDAICPDPKHKAQLAPVLVNRELRKETKDGASTRHIELDLSGIPLEYLTADNLGVYPRNDFKLASQLAKRLGVRFNQTFRLQRVSKSSGDSGNDDQDKIPPVPSPCSVEDALLWHADFNCLARASHVAVLSQFTNDEREKAQIDTWCAPSFDFSKLEMSFFEVLNALSGVTLPFGAFLEWCPKLQPRFYTISSSSIVNPKLVSITVALTITPKSNERVHYGVASSYLCGLREGKDKACVFVRPSSFRLPAPIGNVMPPIIMIGPGTGIAPFRAFVQEFHYQKENQGVQPAHTALYFGCRNPLHDYIYEDELTKAHLSHVVTDLQIAFSRHESTPKVYVQDLMKKQGESLWKSIHDNGGYVYVCGGTSMGRSVRETIIQIAQEYGKLNATQAAEYFKKLQDTHRYVAELWS